MGPGSFSSLHRTKAVVQRGTMRGPVQRSSGVDIQATYLMTLHVAIIFLGGVSLCMLAYSWLSPYWLMMGRRAYTLTPELRVLGLTRLMEGNEPIGPEWLWSKKTLRKGYYLSERRDRICDEELDKDDAYSGQDGDCDLDCQDMKLLGSLRVLCDADGHQIEPREIPIVPAPRIRAAFNESMQQENNDGLDLTLRWGCDSKPSFFTRIRCPVGYKRCHESLERRCTVGSSQWREPACCVDQDLRSLGSTMFGVDEAPTYIHVFGWAEWQVKALREEEGTLSRGSNWCSVRSFRCQTLQQFAANGRRCFNCLTVAGILMFSALVLQVGPFKRRAVAGVALLFALAAAVVLYANFSYYGSNRRTLELTMTPVDKWGRPYIHSMNNYDYNGRTIRSMPADDPTSAEWMYYHVNARVDYVTSDPNNPSGFTLLWGAYFSLTAGVVSLVTSLVCIEMQCALAGFHPLAKFFSIVLAAVLFVPSKAKKFVDDNLAAYPVLHVYPWQKLYAKAFTAGSWLPWPLDQMWDYGLMLPLHCTRAIWDYVSCQDITSPQEKEVLHGMGIYNDRLCSLLCSRRSYFAMMAGLGAVSFIVNLTEVIGISDRLAHLRQARARSGSYPIYRCTSSEGDCPADQPDPVSMGLYAKEMATRLVSTIYEGSIAVDTSRALVEWLGGFVAISCAAGALANWTNFRLSRKFCLIGWIFMMLTPVITSSFPDNRKVDWPVVEDQIVEVSAEMWEEIIYHVSKQSCSQIVNTLDTMYDKGHVACSWARTLRVLVPQSALDGCDWFDEFGEEKYEEFMKNSTTICKDVKMYTENGVEARKQCNEKVRSVTPGIVDTFKILIGLKAGVKNKIKLMSAVMGMAPALMQGGLMIKNMIPRQTTPAILTTLPFAYATLIWAQYQVYYQVFTGYTFLLACLALSFGPLVYYVFAKYYRVVQPMCDQQSVTLTFRIWWYAALCSLIMPYSLLGAYFLFLNDFKRDVVAEYVTSLDAIAVVSTVVSTLSSFAYSLQAGIDWFVDEIVSHHATLHAPAVLTATISKQEANSLQKILGSSLDLDSIDKGTYVCGGLGDAARLRPPEEGSWEEKARIYSSSLAYKDFATLDAFAGHIKGDPGLPAVLARARKPWYRALNSPPNGAFDGTEVVGAEPQEAPRIPEPESAAAPSPDDAEES